MPFTAAELTNLANAALDFYIKGDTFKQTIQDKPLLEMMRRAKKTFPGGKEMISIGVLGDYTTEIAGFSHDDDVGYANPANIKRVQYPWYEIHAGISLTLTELKHDGISVVDSTSGENVSKHSGREMTALHNIFDHKLHDMGEGWARGFNEMLWLDGTQDAKLVPGIKSIIVDDPTNAVVGGLDGSSISWWRNRSLVNNTSTGGSDNRIATTSSGLEVIEKIHTEMRQLRRYGGRPNFAPCGSDWLDRLASEVRSKGEFTNGGFAGKTDISSGEFTYQGLTFKYDPTLDDLGEAKRCYVMDTSKLSLYAMEGEDMKQHAPARPAEKYVMYRAMTWTGGLVCTQRNAHGVYEFK